MNEPTADEIMKMFAVDIAVLRRGRRKPSEKPPVGKEEGESVEKAGQAYCGTARTET